jgi:putative AlgH/UPF0301 family transcriptional regulator
MTIEITSEPKLSLEGKLLVATPYVDQPPYRHAVVLIMQHSSRGSCGLVIENNLQANLAKIEGKIPLEVSHNRLEEVAHDQDHPDEERSALQLFAGCILWPAGQLERELESGIWMTTTARLNASLLTDDLWLSLLTKIGRSVLEDTLQIKNFPQDATWN